MSELTNEQNFNIQKYGLDSNVQYLEPGINTVKQLLASAKTSEDLEKAKCYFEALLQSSTYNLSKIIIVDQPQNIK